MMCFLVEVALEFGSHCLYLAHSQMVSFGFITRDRDSVSRLIEEDGV